MDDTVTLNALHTVAPDSSANSTLSNSAGWQRANTTFYHIWVSSFYDSGSDSIGDLPGITAKINANYFTDLGINALWLSPIFKAATLTSGSANRHGYDTIDYSTVATIYGTNSDLKTLIQTAHSKGIRVIFDFVPNHTSNQNPWFTSNPTSDWYVYKNTKPSGWNGFDSNSDWYGAGPYYYAVFGSSMPDLNYRNKSVQNAMANVVLDWLNFGFDGLRVDAIKYLFEGAVPAEFQDEQGTYNYFQALRSQVVDPFTTAGSAKFMIAENGDTSLSNLISYMQQNGKKGFNMTLDFIWPYVIRDNLSGSGTVAEVNNILGHLVTDNIALPAGTSFGVFQSNHDNFVSRPATSYSGNGGKVFLAAALSILGRGTPFIYYGNEIGMTGVAGNDINLRQPFDWTSEASEASDPASLWTWHSQLLKLRSHYGAYNDPTIAGLSTGDSQTLAFLVTGTLGQRVVVVANLASSSKTSFSVTVSGSWSTATPILGQSDQSVSSGSSITVQNLPGFGLRVYALDDVAATIFRSTDADSSGFTPVLPTLYLRGDFNSWGTTALSSLGSHKFKGSFTAGSTGTVGFKFGTSDWLTAYGFNDLTYDATLASGALGSGSFSSSGSPNYNIVFTATSGKTYDCYIDQVNLKYCVVQN